MAIEKNIAASILSAATRNIGEKAYGNMLLGIPGDEKALEEAIDFIRQTPEIAVEVVK